MTWRGGEEDRRDSPRQDRGQRDARGARVEPPIRMNRRGKGGRLTSCTPGDT